ncbi:MAG: 23S rRNA (pseudouridine(1915)-N(3))-methyltransferase RlmH [Eubacteriales bacterium]|nr:23S rRNA (pseudouridine(1915)-N(3))-methyltransferase RlmH [Eubacteriales bacterium]
MKIRIISPGKIREKYLQDAVEIAQLNLQRNLATGDAIEIIEVEDSPDTWPVDRAMQMEAERIRARLLPGDYLIALDLAGHWPKQDKRGTLAPDLARWLGDAREYTSNLVFMIGGSNGLAPELKRQARQRICLSQMTYTHQMARLILLDLLNQAWI